MKLSFIGDVRQLRKFAQRVERSQRVNRVINDQLAEETIDLIKEGFKTSRDPFGNRWAKLKLRSGRPLVDTGRLKNSFYKKSVGKTGFRVGSDVSYSDIHQDGSGIFGRSGKRIKPKRAKALRIPVRGSGALFFKSVKGVPKRRMVPRRGKLPSKWSRAYTEVAEDVLTETFRS